VCEVEMKDMKHPTDDGYNHGRRPKFYVRSSPSRRDRAFGADLFEKVCLLSFKADYCWIKFG
jgi:hypothetical protein